jgi:hypothetical protein
MKLLQGILLFCLLGMTLPAHAGDQQVQAQALVPMQAQADVLLAKISAALKDDRTSVALIYCTKLEKLEPSLAKALPESFYYDYIETLYRSKVKESALNRSYAYLQKYGKNAPHAEQVTAIIREWQTEEMRAGNGDADGAVLAREEASRQEHEQNLQVLRACQSEAIALEAAEKELSVAYEEITTQSNALLSTKAALDAREIMLNQAGPGKPQAQVRLRTAFNRDTQAYNAAVDAFARARDLYASRVAENDNRYQGYDARCGNLVVLESELKTVCGSSNDLFCRSLE